MFFERPWPHMHLVGLLHAVHAIPTFHLHHGFSSHIHLLATKDRMPRLVKYSAYIHPFSGRPSIYRLPVADDCHAT